MKKLIVTLLAIALLCTFALPALADENSPVKDYATAEDGELLYTFDFSGKDGVLDLRNIGGKHADEYFYYIPSADGTSLQVYGREDAGEDKYTAYYGATIPSLEANFSTTYTFTYKVAMHGKGGRDNSVGIGAYFTSGYTDSSLSAYHLYGNYSTSSFTGDISTRRSSLSINNMKQNEYVMWSTLRAYEVDEDGFITAMLVYEGATLTLTAYIRAEGAGDGSKESDWVKVEELIYVPGDDCMGFFIYAYYVDIVNVTVKDAKLYKGKIFASDEPVVEPTEEPTEAPTTKPTSAPATQPTTPTTATTEAPEAEAAGEFPVGAVIGIVAAVVVVAVVVVILLKKKK